MSETRNYPEYEIQCAFENYLLTYHPNLLATASPMGVNLPVHKAVMLKRKGCRPTYPDHMAFLRKVDKLGNIYGALFIEFKAYGKRVIKKSDQAKTILELAHIGYFVRIVDSVESAIETLETYLALDDAPEIVVKKKDEKVKESDVDETKGTLKHSKETKLEISPIERIPRGFGKRCYDEYEMQCAFEAHLLKRHPHILATGSPMGVDLPHVRANILKKKGCRPSYPDFWIFCRKVDKLGNLYGAAAFELKAPDKYVEEDSLQAQTLVTLANLGYFVRVNNSLESAIRSLEYYLAMEDAPPLVVKR